MDFKLFTSPLNPIILPETGVMAGTAAKATEERKLKANVAECADLGWVCVPVVAESYGAWGLETVDFNMHPALLHQWENQSLWSSMKCMGG